MALDQRSLSLLDWRHLEVGPISTIADIEWACELVVRGVV